MRTNINLNYTERFRSNRAVNIQSLGCISRSAIMRRETSLFVLKSIKSTKILCVQSVENFWTLNWLYIKNPLGLKGLSDLCLKWEQKMQVALYAKWLNFGTILNRAECVHTYLVGIPNIKFHQNRKAVFDSITLAERRTSDFNNQGGNYA